MASDSFRNRIFINGVDLVDLMKTNTQEQMVAQQFSDGNLTSRIGSYGTSSQPSGYNITIPTIKVSGNKITSIANNTVSVDRSYCAHCSYCTYCNAQCKQCAQCSKKSASSSSNCSC